MWKWKCPVKNMLLRTWALGEALFVTGAVKEAGSREHCWAFPLTANSPKNNLTFKDQTIS